MLTPISGKKWGLPFNTYMHIPIEFKDDICVDYFPKVLHATFSGQRQIISQIKQNDSESESRHFDRVQRRLRAHCHDSGRLRLRTPGPQHTSWTSTRPNMRWGRTEWITRWFGMSKFNPSIFSAFTDPFFRLTRCSIPHIPKPKISRAWWMISTWYVADPAPIPDMVTVGGWSGAFKRLSSLAGDQPKKPRWSVRRSILFENQIAMKPNQNAEPEPNCNSSSQKTTNGEF